jgi:hypothetical protein
VAECVRGLAHLLQPVAQRVEIHVHRGRGEAVRVETRAELRTSIRRPDVSRRSAVPP